jgi:hypothetical protein
MEVKVTVVLDISVEGDGGYGQSLERVEIAGFTEEVREATCWGLPELAWAAFEEMREAAGGLVKFTEVG